jgi:uncharacterized membrane protein
MMKSADEENRETVEEGVTVSSRLLLFLVLGFVLVFVGITIILIAAVLYGGGSASAGAVIFIWPFFPIVIGAGPDVTLIVLFSIILAVLSVVVFLVMNRRLRRSGS